MLDGASFRLIAVAYFLDETRRRCAPASSKWPDSKNKTDIFEGYILFFLFLLSKEERVDEIFIRDEG